MKIIYISSSVVPSKAANSIHVMKMSEAFAQHGHDVILIARDSRERNTQDNFNVYDYYGVKRCFDILWFPWPAPKIGGLVYGWYCFRSLPKLAPDVVYARSIYGALVAVNRGLPCIYEAHTPPHSWIQYLLEKALFRSKSFKHLVVISEALKREYERLYPWLDDNRILVAHDGADLPPEEKQIASIAKWPGRPGSPQIGYVGQLYPGKGIEVIAELAKRLPEMDFHVIGGSDADVCRWKQRARYRNLFFHGFVPPRQTPQYRAMCDILLLPAQYKVSTTSSGRGDISRWMSPLKLFEYMASKRAIIASNLPTVCEVLRDGYNALLVQPDDIEGWVQALQRLSEDKELRKRLAENAYADLVSKYTWFQRAEYVI